MNFVVIDVSVLEGAIGAVKGCVHRLMDIADGSTYEIGNGEDWYISWKNALDVSPHDSGQIKRLKQIFKNLTLMKLKTKFCFVGHRGILYDASLRDGYCDVVCDTKAAVIQSFFYLPEMALTKKCRSKNC